VFVDEVRVHLRSGDGGAGNTAFVKARGRPRGKPLGGSGGHGGDVVVVADAGVATLLDYQHRPHRRADSGTHGRGDMQHGRRGQDLLLPVPPGTVVRDASGTVIADLAVAGQRVTVLKGGRGGLGNAALAGPRRLAPSYSEQGEYGAAADFVFELKVVADAAIIGFPNAGKSTLISRVSAARPKVADYPFTTTVPHLGVVDVSGRRFVLADIPGLIEGAAEGRGLGHVFLRHVERCRALLFLLDPSPLQGLSCARQLGILRDELRRHDPSLADRPALVAVGKADLPEAGEQVRALEAAGVDALAVSGVTGAGVEALMHALADLLGTIDRRGEGEGFILHRPVGEGFTVDRVEGRWIVSGRRAERAVALDDLTKPEAADLAARRLARAGVDAELRRLGAVPGDEVQIGTIVFEFRDDQAEPADGETLPD
jgi:GTP-binding protein